MHTTYAFIVNFEPHLLLFCETDENKQKEVGFGPYFNSFSFIKFKIFVKWDEGKCCGWVGGAVGSDVKDLPPLNPTHPSATIFYLSTFLSLRSFFFFLNGPTPASFSFIFGLFKQTLQFLQQIIVKNVHPLYGAGNRTHDLWNVSLFTLPLDQGSLCLHMTNHQIQLTRLGI